MTSPSPATATVNDLFAATRSEPTYRHTSHDQRSVTTYWTLPGATPDAHQFTASAELRVTHDKDAKQYPATLRSTTIRLYPSGGFGQSFQLGGPATQVCVLTATATRFSAVNFAKFARTVTTTIDHNAAGIPEPSSANA